MLQIYWFVSGACISAYSTGSSLLAYGEALRCALLTLGLTAQQSMACVVVGAIITGLLSCVCGIAGEVHHIGYTVLARSHWGMKGAYFVSCPVGTVMKAEHRTSPCVFESSPRCGGSVSRRTGEHKLSIWSVLL